MSLICIDADRLPQTVDDNLRGQVLIGDPALYTDGSGTTWRVHSDDRWPARQPRNDDGTPKAQSGPIRVYDGLPEGWEPKTD